MIVINLNDIKVCIPSYGEPAITKTLDSLAACDFDNLKVEVRVLINGCSNDSEEIQKQNVDSFEAVEKWIKSYQGKLSFKAMKDLDLPKKHAGVGLARKILGDSAAADFKTDNINGIIVYLDADCTVKPNYFQAIHTFFKEAKHDAAAIHFEHEILDEIKDRAIIEYELHLRYYMLMQRYLNLPFAIHTVGSSMACLSESYTAKGGMNKRKAGEDFYFLQKFIKDGVCGNIIDTTVIPSARKSERVPFGTGRAMLKYEEEDYEWQTYNPEAFLLLKPFIDSVDAFYDKEISFKGLDEELVSYLDTIDAKKNIENIKQNVASKVAFEKRFFQFFDAFQLMKYLHFMRDECGVLDVPIAEGINWYMENVMNEEFKYPRGTLLLRIREIDNK
jgi:hypothetical protein